MKRLVLALSLVAVPAFAQQPPPLEQQVYAVTADVQDKVSMLRNLVLQQAAQIADLQKKVADLTKAADPVKPMPSKP